MESIFVDCHVFDGGYQGSRTYIKGLYSSLIPMVPTIRFYLAAVDIENLKRNFGEYGNVTYLRYNSHNKYYRMLFDIPRMIKKHRIQWGHFQYMLPALKLCNEITTIHDVLFLDFPQYFSFKYRFVFNWLFKKAANRSELLLTVSEYSKDRIAYYYSINKSHIHITPNGIPAMKLEESTTKNFILYVSRIEARKNHVGLIKAYVNSKLFVEGIKLIIAGRKSSEVPTLDAYVASLPQKIRTNIIFCTPTDKELRDLYSSCKLFVYPSLAEGFGIPPLEAALYRKPVLCANATAMEEFRDLGFYMFDPNSDKEFSDKLFQLSHLNFDPIELEKTALKIQQKYNWEYSAQLFLKYVNQFENQNSTLS